MEIKMDSSESDVIPIITDHVNSYEKSCAPNMY